MWVWCDMFFTREISQFLVPSLNSNSRRKCYIPHSTDGDINIKFRLEAIVEMHTKSSIATGTDSWAANLWVFCTTTAAAVEWVDEVMGRCDEIMGRCDEVMGWCDDAKVHFWACHIRRPSVKPRILHQAFTHLKGKNTSRFPNHWDLWMIWSEGRSACYVLHSSYIHDRPCIYWLDYDVCITKTVD